MKYKAVAALVASLRDILDMIPHRSMACDNNPASRRPCFCHKQAIHERIDELQGELAKED